MSFMEGKQGIVFHHFSISILSKVYTSDHLSYTTYPNQYHWNRIYLKKMRANTFSQRAIVINSIRTIAWLCSLILSYHILNILKFHTNVLQNYLKSTWPYCTHLWMFYSCFQPVQIFTIFLLCKSCVSEKDLCKVNLWYSF